MVEICERLMDTSSHFKAGFGHQHQYIATKAKVQTDFCSKCGVLGKAKGGSTLGQVKLKPMFNQPPPVRECNLGWDCLSWIGLGLGLHQYPAWPNC